MAIISYADAYRKHLEEQKNADKKDIGLTRKYSLESGSDPGADIILGTLFMNPAKVARGVASATGKEMSEGAKKAVGIMSTPRAKVEQGFFGAAEGITDFFAGIGAQAVGQKEAAKWVYDHSWAQKAVGADVTDEFVGEDIASSTGYRLASDLLSGVGNVGFQIAIGSLIGGALSAPLEAGTISEAGAKAVQYLPLFFSAAGSGTAENYEKSGRLGWRENLGGVLKGGLEVATEIISPTGKLLDRALYGKTMQEANKYLVKHAIAKGILSSFVGEFGEEAASYAGGWAIENALGISKEKFSVKDMLYQGMMGGITGALFAAPNDVALVRTARNAGKKTYAQGEAYVRDKINEGRVEIARLKEFGNADSNNVKLAESALNAIETDETLDQKTREYYMGLAQQSVMREELNAYMKLQSALVVEQAKADPAQAQKLADALNAVVNEAGGKGEYKATDFTDPNSGAVRLYAVGVLGNDFLSASQNERTLKAILDNTYMADEYTGSAEQTTAIRNLKNDEMLVFKVDYTENGNAYAVVARQQGVEGDANYTVGYTTYEHIKNADGKMLAINGLTADAAMDFLGQNMSAADIDEYIKRDEARQAQPTEPKTEPKPETKPETKKKKTEPKPEGKPKPTTKKETKPKPEPKPKPTKKTETKPETPAEPKAETPAEPKTETSPATTEGVETGAVETPIETPETTETKLETTPVETPETTETTEQTGETEGKPEQTGKPEVKPTRKKGKPKVVSTTTSITDFGEKIGGARKDLWEGRGLNKSDLGDMNDAEANKYARKEFVWKKPNYEKLVQAGQDRLVLFGKSLLRKLIKPAPDYRYRISESSKAMAREEYVEEVSKIRDQVESITDWDGFKTLLKWLEDNEYIDKVTTLDGVTYYSRDAHRWYSSQAFSLKRKSTFGDFVNTVEYFTQQSTRKIIEAYANKEQFCVNESNKLPKGFKIVSDWSGRWWDLKRGKETIWKGFASVDEAIEYVRKNFPEETQEGGKKDAKGRYVPPQLSSIHRTGYNYRAGGDATGQDFIDTFSFRGGEFGNWMSEKDKQFSLNYGFDALMDLADAVGIDYKSIAFNGKLAIAFGSRGKGNALAHYEPLRNVINLTKMRGAGSLAHEWWHALDYFLSSDSKAATVNGRYGAKNSEIGAAVADLVKTMRYDSNGAQTKFYKDAQTLDGAFAKEGGYWQSEKEMTARAFATYVYDKLTEQGFKDDYLAGHAEAATTTHNGQIAYGYPVGEERTRINAAFDKVFDAATKTGVLQKQTASSKPELISYNPKGKKKGQTTTAQTAQTEQTTNAATPEDLSSLERRMMPTLGFSTTEFSKEEWAQARKYVPSLDRLSKRSQANVLTLVRTAQGMNLDEKYVEGLARMSSVYGFGVIFNPNIQSKGFCVRSDGMVVINPRSIDDTIGHEIWHTIDQTKDGDFRADVIDTVRRVVGAKVFDAAKQDYKTRYEAQFGESLSAEELDGEAAASVVGNYLANMNFVQRFARANLSLCQSVLTSIRAMKKKWQMAKTFAEQNDTTKFAEYRKMSRIELLLMNELTAKKLPSYPVGAFDISFSISEAETIKRGQKEFLEKKGLLSAEELQSAQEATDAMVELMKGYADKLPQDRIGKTIVKNGSYDLSIENTTICVRTLAYNEFIDKVQEKIGRPLSQMESFLVSQKLYEIATQPQCLYCYVSLDRKAYNEYILRYFQQRDDVIAKYKAMTDKSDKAVFGEILTENGKTVYGKKNHALRKGGLYEEYLAGRADTADQEIRFRNWIGLAELPDDQLLKLSDVATEAQKAKLKDEKSSFGEQFRMAHAYARDASHAKLQHEYVAYKDEILKLSPNIVSHLNKHYGLRWYSFSDYSAAFIVENMQQITDAALRGLKGLAYTKDTDFAEIFAPTGMGINISVFVKEDENGNFYIDPLQSADIDKAIELRKHDNVGIVAVATSDEAIKWALQQEWSDVVIPFHLVRSGGQVAEFYDWQVYTHESGDTVSDKNLWESYQKSVGSKRASKLIYPSEHNNDYETYIALCTARGLKPRFDRFRNMEGISHEQYMKLVNETRLPASKTQPLKPNFDLKAAERSWTAFKQKGGYWGSWYKDNTDVDAHATQVAQDVLAGKKANEVTYGRQDKFKPEDLMRARKKVRQHGISQSPADISYSVPEVDPVKPKSTAWQRSKTTEEVKQMYPNLWDVAADESETRNPTQVTNTVNSYRKVYDYLKSIGFTGTILDASSGLGHGTRLGIDEYGFDVDDIEPFPDESYKPKYSDYSALDKKYDVIISNAVLNVLPQDIRDGLVVKMGELLAPGGYLFVNTRGEDVMNASSKEIIDRDNLEVYISKTGSYQKGFRKGELVSYLQDALGNGYTVAPANFFGKAAAVVRKKASGVSYSPSGVSKATDARYAELAKEPKKNESELRKLVKEAAKAAGYNYEGYHGTNAKFTVFSKEKLGEKNWLAESAYMGFFAAASEDTAKNYTGINQWDAWSAMQSKEAQAVLDDARSKYNYDRSKEEYEKAKNAFYDKWRNEHGYKGLVTDIIDSYRKNMLEYDALDNDVKKNADKLLDDIRSSLDYQWNNLNDNYANMRSAFENADIAEKDAFKEVEKKIESEMREYIIKKKGYTPNIMHLFIKLENPLVHDFKKEGRDTDFSGLMETAKKNGNDGCIFLNVKDGGDFDTIYTVFDNTQFKSADPVTYDDSGNVIPLSERFNPQNDDIRYSPASANTSGRVVTQAQPARQSIPEQITNAKGQFNRQGFRNALKEGGSIVEGIKIVAVNAQQAIENHLVSMGMTKRQAAAVVQYARTGRSHSLQAIQYKLADMNGEIRSEGLLKIIEPFLATKGEVYDAVDPKTGETKQSVAKGGELAGKLYDEFSDYYAMLHALDRAAAKKNPYSDMSVAEMQAWVDKHEKAHPEFKKAAEQLSAFNSAVLDIEVQAGILSQETADAWREKFPHYVPMYVQEDGQIGRSPVKGARNLEVKRDNASATESNHRVNDALKNYINQVQRRIRAAKLNLVLQELYNNADGENVVTAEDARQEARDLRERERAYLENPESETDPADMFRKVQKGRKTVNEVSFYIEGKRVTMAVNDRIYTGLTDLTGVHSSILDSGIAKFASKINSTFKKLVTNWNPFFAVKNIARDLQDGTLQSRFGMGEFLNMYRKNAEMMATGKYNHLWEEFLANGGLESSLYSDEFGTLAKGGKSGLEQATGIVGQFQHIKNFNTLTEALPRFTEYCLTRKHGGTVQTALLNAADVTVNFGRSGTLFRILNSTVSPFLNPAMQGLDRVIRLFTEEGIKNNKALASLLLKAVLLAIVPMALGNAMYGNDDEYKDMKDSVKENNYLFKIGDTWLKLPRGRVVSTISGLFNRTSKQLMGGDVDWKDYGKNVLDQITPAQNVARTIWSPFADVANNRTWYGTKIESEALQNYAVKDRYDENTSRVSVWVGQLTSHFGLSPKEVNYLIDQYTGVVGDILLPTTTPAGTKGVVSYNFTVDPNTSSNLSNRFYDLYNKTMYKANDGDEEAYYLKRRLDETKSAVSDLFKQIKTINADKSLSNKEKVKQVSALRATINQLYKTALADKNLYAQNIKVALGIDNSYAVEQITAQSAKQYGLDKDSVGKYALTFGGQFAKQFDTEEQANSYKADTSKKTIYAETNRLTYGAEYALKEYSSTVYEKAQKLNELGISYDEYYNYYMTVRYYSGADKKKKILAYLNASDLSKSEIALMMYYSGYSAYADEAKKAIQSSSLSAERKKELLAGLTN